MTGNFGFSNDEFMNSLRIYSQQLKAFEAKKDYENANKSIDVIVNLFDDHIKKGENTQDYVKYLSILSSSYCKKKSDYEYFSFVNEKTALIKRKMAEKYLGKRVTKDASGSNNLIGLSEYEIVKTNSSHISLIKEIVEICCSLIKYYTLQIQKSPEKNINNLKTIQTYESFFIYEYQNTTLNLNSISILDKYVEEIKNIKSECEKIIEYDYTSDDGKIQTLEKQINIIKEEFQKIYPKYLNLKEILEKNNLVRGNKNQQKK